MATRSGRGQITIQFEGSIANTPTTTESGKAINAAVTARQIVELTDGTGVDNIDRAFVFIDASIATSETNIYRVFDHTIVNSGAGTASTNIGFGAGNDNVGQSLTTGGFVDLAALIILNTGTTQIRFSAGNVAAGTDAIPFVTVGGAPTVADFYNIPAGGFFAIGGGENNWSVLNGTADSFILTNASGAAAGEYTIVILGRSA